MQNWFAISSVVISLLNHVTTCSFSVSIGKDFLFRLIYGIIGNVTAPILVAGRGAQHGICNLICCLCCGRCSRILHLQMVEQRSIAGNQPRLLKPKKPQQSHLLGFAFALNMKTQSHLLPRHSIAYAKSVCNIPGRYFSSVLNRVTIGHFPASTGKCFCFNQIMVQFAMLPPQYW